MGAWNWNWSPDLRISLTMEKHEESIRVMEEPVRENFGAFLRDWRIPPQAGLDIDG